MRPNCFGGFLILAICLAAPANAQVDFSNFITPDGATAPFEDWSRGDAGSSFAAWEIFTTTLGANTHFPDFTSTLPGAPILPAGGVATVTESGAADIDEDGLNDNGAFITSTLNIYSSTAPIDFEVVLSGEDLGAGYSTRFVAQVGTLGSLADPGSYTLTYQDSLGETVQLAPSSNDEVRNEEIIGGFGGTLQERIVVWDIAGFNPAELVMTFGAAGSSMSLDYMTVDVFTYEAALPGDYDGDGSVDDTDYALWRSQYGTSVSAFSGADGNGDGVVDAADYTVWRNNMTPATGAAAAVVPEPSVLALFLVAFSMAYWIGFVRWPGMAGRAR